MPQCRILLHNRNEDIGRIYYLKEELSRYGVFHRCEGMKKRKTLGLPFVIVSSLMMISLSW